MQEYYDLKKNWRKVKRHIGHPDVEAILVRDFNRYTWGRWRKKFQPGMVPHEFEYCDWCCGHRGSMPKFWQYTKHSACHWLVNFSLRLAERVEPDRPWRIITSDSHSTVWDGTGLLFDFNLQAMGSHPERCFDLAYYGSARAELLPGELLDVYFAEHWKREQKRLEKEQELPHLHLDGGRRRGSANRICRDRWRLDGSPE